MGMMKDKKTWKINLMRTVINMKILQEQEKKGKALEEVDHTNAKRGEYYHFEFELMPDGKGGFNVFAGERSMKSGSSLDGVKEWVNEWLDETFTKETAPVNKYKYYIIDDRNIEGNIFAHTAQEARELVAKKYKVNLAEVDVDIIHQ